MLELIIQYLPYVLIPIVGGIVLSYSTEVLDSITPEWFKSKYSLFIFSVILIFLETKAFESYYFNLYGFIFGYFANIVVALGFYKKYGKKFVDGVGTFIFNYLKKFLNKKIKKLDNNEPLGE
jgi:hypothetical protein